MIGSEMLTTLIQRYKVGPLPEFAGGSSEQLMGRCIVNVRNGVISMAVPFERYLT